MFKKVYIRVRLIENLITIGSPDGLPTGKRLFKARVFFFNANSNQCSLKPAMINYTNTLLGVGYTSTKKYHFYYAVKTSFHPGTLKRALGKQSTQALDELSEDLINTQTAAAVGRSATGF